MSSSCLGIARTAGIALGLCGALAACSASKTGNHGSVGGGGGGGGDGGTIVGGGGGSGGIGGAGGGLGGGIGPGGSGGGDGCDDLTKGSIYVLGEEKQFARFEPQTLTFTVMGTLACPGAFGSTFSMSVDRKGVAWVLFADGNVFHVDTKTLACTATGFQTCQSNFCNFGMGFVADAPGSDAETLYVSGVYNGPPGEGLARIDPQSLALIPIADYDGILTGKGAELTGTGNAQLFGYFQDTPIRLAEIDKASAHIVNSTDLLEIPVGTSWAFAFWGGSFYIMSGTGIRKYDPMTQITTLINGNVGFNIVGAGVSTCAPTEEPQ